MKARDTVISDGKIWEITNYEPHSKEPLTLQDGRRVAKAQAEISFKAGIKEGIWMFAWWKDGVQYVGTCGKTLKEALDEVDGKPSSRNG